MLTTMYAVYYKIKSMGSNFTLLHPSGIERRVSNRRFKDVNIDIKQPLYSKTKEVLAAQVLAQELNYECSKKRVITIDFKNDEVY